MAKQYLKKSLPSKQNGAHISRFFGDFHGFSIEIEHFQQFSLS
jgi:hypothetical protein